MKQAFLLVIIGLALHSNAQKIDTNVTPDTAINTKIQQALKLKSTTIKKEFIKIDDVRALQFQILVVTDLKSEIKTKGLYLDNQNKIIGSSRTPPRHAYLDENELDDLIEFLINCDKTWKNDKPVNHTEYVYTTNDNLRVSFWTDGGANWKYSIEFTNYLIDNEISMTKKNSDDLVDALQKIKMQMNSL